MVTRGRHSGNDCIVTPGRIACHRPMQEGFLLTRDAKREVFDIAMFAPAEDDVRSARKSSDVSRVRRLPKLTRSGRS
jgi:hypothetical protein